MSANFPFEIVEPEDMKPGLKYYIGMKRARNYTRRTKAGMVRKASGVFQRLSNFRGVLYAEFTNVAVEDKAAKTLLYNSGKIRNPYFNADNIMKGRRRPNGRLKSMKMAGHQEMNLKGFHTKNWFFPVAKWQFGAGIKNAAETYMIKQVMAKHVPIEFQYPVQNLFSKTEANKDFEYVPENENGNGKANNNTGSEPRSKSASRASNTNEA
jgi:hypothetical protein